MECKSYLRSINLLSTSIGIIYCWFGLLKFFLGYSPAEQLAIATIRALTFKLLPDHVSLMLLAIFESAIGLLFIFKWFMRQALALMFMHMFFTFLPFLLFPSQTFAHIPYDFTLLGQYIMKNVIIISAGLVLWQHYHLVNARLKIETPSI